MKLAERQALPPAVRWILDRCDVTADTTEDDCYTWKQRRKPHGRPVAKYKDETIAPQHVVYDAMVQPHFRLRLQLKVDDRGRLDVTGRRLNLCMRVLCDNPACCNWRHMEPVTQAQSQRDSAKRGRLVTFSRITSCRRAARARVSDKMDMARAMRLHELVRGGMTVTAAAREVGTNLKNASLIITGKRWAEAAGGSWIPVMPSRKRATP